MKYCVHPQTWWFKYSKGACERFQEIRVSDSLSSITSFVESSSALDLFRKNLKNLHSWLFPWSGPVFRHIFRMGSAITSSIKVSDISLQSLQSFTTRVSPNIISSILLSTIAKPSGPTLETLIGTNNVTSIVTKTYTNLTHETALPITSSPVAGIVWHAWFSSYGRAG